MAFSWKGLACFSPDLRLFEFQPCRPFQVRVPDRRLQLMILQNKPNSSSSSTNKDTSIRYDCLFLEATETADLKSRLRWTASAFTSAAFRRTTRRGKRELERVQRARSFPSDHTPGKRSGITSPACVDNGFETDRSSWLRG